MLRAKRSIETLIETGRVFVDLPTVESVETLVGDLAEAGVAAAAVERAYAPMPETISRSVGETHE